MSPDLVLFCRPFTAAEDARIIELFGLRMPQTHIARALNRSYSSLWGRVKFLRQRGMISQPVSATATSLPPSNQPAGDAGNTATKTSPVAGTEDAQGTVASSSHSTLVMASSNAVPGSQAPVHDPQVGPNSASAATSLAPLNPPDKKATAPSKFPPVRTFSTS